MLLNLTGKQAHGRHANYTMAPQIQQTAVAQSFKAVPLHTPPLQIV